MDCIGEYLDYQECGTGPKCYEPNGTLTVCNRPSVTGNANMPEFWANVTMKNGKIDKVE